MPSTQPQAAWRGAAGGPLVLGDSGAPCRDGTEAARGPPVTPPEYSCGLGPRGTGDQDKLQPPRAVARLETEPTWHQALACLLGALGTQCAQSHTPQPLPVVTRA